MADDANASSRDVLTRALAASISQRYPGRLTGEQSEAIRQALGPVVDLAAMLRQFRLTNADEPDPIFRVYRGEG